MSTPGDRPPVSPFVGDSEMAQRMRAFDWSGTPIGPVHEWPQSLRTAVGICLSSRHPMVIWWGPQLVLLYNDAWVPILGPSKHPALGKPGASVWPEMWHIIGEQMRSVLATGQATWSDDQLLPARRFGYLEEAYFTYSYSAIHDETGAVGGVFTAVTETTSRVLGERRLRTLRALGEVSAVTAPSAERACAAALEVLSDNRADLPFALIYLLAENGAGARLVGGYGVDSGAVGCALAPPTVPHANGEDLVWQVVSSGQPTVATGLSQRCPGALLPGVTDVGPGEPDTAVVLPLAAAGQDRLAGVLVTGISPFRALDEDYRGFCDLVAGHVASAVADARAYQAERRRSAALAELDRAKTEFFSNISHEFRTPLTLIMGPLAELRSAPELSGHARLREELEVIHRNGLRLGKLVNTLLDFSRIQAGRLQASYQPVDLSVCTTELASVFRSAIERAGLEFVVDCADLGEPVYLDREMWEKVVLNLLSNALKFTFEGGITVTVRRCDDTAVVTVADTGAGIPAEEMPRLFDRFHRIRGVRSRSNEGSGIGLALVAQLVALHGGTITADSTPDVGTTFTVTLPLGRAHLPADQITAPAAGAGITQTAQPFVEEALQWLPDGDQTPTGGAPAAPGAADAPGPPQGRVLVADDNADMREYLQRLLTARYAVQTVPDGLTALAAARAQPPDLIVSDVMMPGLDGLELLAALRADERTARVPVLLLSARAGQEAAVEGLAAGADDYLVKPFSAGELLARVGAHLQLSRVRREAEVRFRVMADLAPALIWAANREGERVFLNRGWQVFTGAEPSTQLGTGWQAGIHPEDLPGYQAVVGQALAARQPWQVEYRLRRADGGYHWVIEHAVPIGEGEFFDGYVGSAVDINTRYQETQRQTLLAELAAALDDETCVAQRMDRLTRVLVDQRFADQCTVFQAGPGAELRRVAIAADDSGTATAPAPDVPAAQQVRATGQPLLIAEVGGGSGVAGDPEPEQLTPRRAGWSSMIAVPLVARGQLLGLLVAGRRADSARYQPHDLELLQEVAGRAGIALDNALLLAEEQATARRLELLQQATAALSAAATPTAVAQTAISHFTRLLAPATVTLYELRDTRTLELLAMLEGSNEVIEQNWKTVPLDGGTPIADAARDRRAVWLESLADLQRDYPEVSAAALDAGLPVFACLPLLVNDTCIGMIGLGFTESRVFSTAERNAAMSLAEQCAQAMHRAQLLASETAARHAAERFNRMVGALSGARSATEVAQVVLDYAADLGAIAAVVVWHGTEEHLSVLAAYGYPDLDGLAVTAAHPLSCAIRTAEPVWLGSRSAAAWRHRAFESQTPLPVQVAIPLIAGHSAIGALGLRFPGSAPAFTPYERATLLSLAGQCGQALDRARLYQSEHDVAQTLQRSLLPRKLPELDRLMLAARYLPGVHDMTAGGDWYDVLALDERRVAIAVGDVVGKGAAAAATMGQLRTALATSLLHGDSPAAALEHLDRVAARIPGAVASTAVTMILDLVTGQLRWARAGHPPPLLLSQGCPRYLTGGLGTPLGVRHRKPFANASTQMEPGAGLLLYTDGLIERRGQSLDDGLDHLAVTAARLHSYPPSTLVDQLLAHALPDNGPPDDIAVIAVRYLPAPLHQRLPARPETLAALRRVIRVWADAAALPSDVTGDLQLTLGEAVANVVEHAYATTPPGDFIYQVTYRSDRSVEVDVHDFGRWRPRPAVAGHRGRGLDMIHKIGTDVVVEPSPAGTHVHFRLLAPSPGPSLRTLC